jgi:hypothetical protein
MVIESTSIRTIIDLLESLRKNSFTASEIRISYTQKGGKKQYVTYASLDSLVANYNQVYTKSIQKKKSPYTSDPSLAAQSQFTTTIGQLLYITNSEPNIFFNSSEFFCTTGSLVTLESFRISSYIKEYQISFIIKDVTGGIIIIDDNKFDLRRQEQIAEVLGRFKSSVQKYIGTYNQIYSRLKNLFDRGQYVDLCYYVIGYAEYTFELYKLFFVINKRKINEGISPDVLKKMYLRAI